MHKIIIEEKISILKRLLKKKIKMKQNKLERSFKYFNYCDGGGDANDHIELPVFVVVHVNLCALHCTSRFFSFRYCFPSSPSTHLSCFHCTHFISNANSLKFMVDPTKRRHSIRTYAANVDICS